VTENAHQADLTIPRFREFPAEAFAPFSESERRLLRRYVQQAEALQDCGYFKGREKLQLTIPGKRGKPSPANLRYPGEDLLRSLLMVLRPLHDGDEPASFARTRNLLASHARAKGGEIAKEALAEFRHYKKAAREVFSHSPFVMSEGITDEGKNSEGGVVTAKSIFDDYLYGSYFHREEERLQRVERWESFPFPKFIFLQSADSLTSIYLHLAGLVIAVLAEPALQS
jgi:hypothetical protein